MIGSFRVKTILFDADGVIQQPADGWTGALEALCGDPSRSSAFLAEIFAAEKPCLTGAGEFSAALAEVLCRWNSSVKVEEALSVWTRIEPDRAMRRLGIHPHEALFLDDHEANVAAARNAGLNAEVYHLSEGLDKVIAILASYGIDAR